MQKNLLSDLFIELQQLYEMYCANEKTRDNKKMKCYLQENLKESICFMPACLIHGNPIVALALEMNPVCLMKRSVFFAKVIHGKIKAQETGTSFPLSAENLSAVVKMAIYIDFFN